MIASERNSGFISKRKSLKKNHRRFYENSTMLSPGGGQRDAFTGSEKNVRQLSAQIQPGAKESFNYSLRRAAARGRTTPCFPGQISVGRWTPSWASANDRQRRQPGKGEKISGGHWLQGSDEL